MRALHRPAGAAAALIAAVVLCACSQSAAAVHAPGSETVRYVHARPVAVALIRTLAAHRPGGRLEAPATAADGRSLGTLTAWLSHMPIAQVRVVASNLPVADHAAAGVILTLSGRLGKPPSTRWLDMGQRALVVRDTPAGWKVVRDITNGSTITLQQTGLGVIPHATYRTGRGFVIIDAAGIDSLPDQVAYAATKSLPRLVAKYGAGSAPGRTPIYLMPDWPLAERVADVGFWHEAVGEELRGTVYIDTTAWRGDGLIYPESVITHELTHVVTARMVRNTPESLIEGVARYEEAGWDASQGAPFNLSLLRTAYADGFSSLDRWTNRARPHWGLDDPDAIDNAYNDGYAIVRTVIVRHGGVAALERLAARFRAMGGQGNLTPAQVRSAFQRALGVSFDQVVGEAREFAAGEAG